MKPLIKKLIMTVFIAFAAIFTSGCLNIRADELYKLPQASEEYLALQASINAVLSSGAEFSPPAGGPNRQSVQLKDLDGDGYSEAIAFFSVSGDSKLKIVVFERAVDDYIIADTIEGVGTAIESIRYADMDGDGVLELIVGWQLDAVLRHMTIHSMRDLHGVLLAGADYSTLTVYDLNGDGNDEAVAFRLPTSEKSGVAEVFELKQDGEIVSDTARLSNHLEKISRVSAGRLLDGSSAVFVEGEGKFDSGSSVTDICAFQGGSFKNVTLSLPDGISEGTVRKIAIYSTDINKDDVIEVPAPRLLKAQSETAYYAIDWFAFSSTGVSSLALTTYHNTFDEWYLIMPFDWRGKVSVRREDAVSGERTIVFSRITENGKPYEDFLKIYKLTGDKKEERATLPGRQVLFTEGTAVYAFELIKTGETLGLTLSESLIRDNFRIIYSDWSGVV